jgi:hypothetical protein
MRSQKASALPSAMHDRMSLKRLRESMSQVEDFSSGHQRAAPGGHSPDASRCRGATTGAADYSAARIGTDDRVCRVVLPWAQDTVLGCSRAPTTSSISSATAARPQATRQALREAPVTGLERPRWPKVHSAVALRVFRIWLSVAPSCQREREFQRSYSFARSGLLGGGSGGWRRLRCRRLE